MRHWGRVTSGVALVPLARKGVFCACWNRRGTWGARQTGRIRCDSRSQYGSPYRRKTNGRNELANVDLMSHNCPIRFVIAVNALREGWDCPFAYVCCASRVL